MKFKYFILLLFVISFSFSQKITTNDFYYKYNKCLKTGRTLGVVGGSTMGLAQIYWSATLSADVEIANVWTLNKNTNRGYFRGGLEYPISFDARVVGAIEAILESDKLPDQSAKDTMEINWIRTVI